MALIKDLLIFVINLCNCYFYQTTEQLTLKVEGVIVNARRDAMFRQVESVTLNLNSHMINRPSHVIDIKVII